MLIRLQNKWMPGLATALVILLTFGSITHLALRLSAERSLQTPAATPAVEAAMPVDPANVARVLGAKAVAVAGKSVEVAEANMASRFVLSGVLAGGKDGWAALISVDGKPAQPVRVGSAVAENLVLQSVAGKTALLGAERTGDVLVTLSLPEPKAGDNQRATGRDDALPSNPEMPNMGGRDPEMGQEKAEIDRNARGRVDSRRPNNPSIPEMSEADAEAFRMIEQIKRNRQQGIGEDRIDTGSGALQR